MFELTPYGKGLLASIKDGRPVPIEKNGYTYNLRNLTQAQMGQLYTEGNSLIQKSEVIPKKDKPKKELSETTTEDPPFIDPEVGHN